MYITLLAALVLIAILYSVGVGNTYYKPAPAKRKNGKHKSDFRAKLRTNVRERQFGVTGNLGTPRAADYMAGGTRPLTSDRTADLVNSKVFQNVHSRVYYEPAIPYRFL